MLLQALVLIEVVSIALALALVYLFLNAYRVKHSYSLLGLPFGFLFLAVSSSFFLGAYFAQNWALFGLFMWLRVVTQCCGFALIAFSYFSSHKPPKSNRRRFLVVLLWSFILVLCIFGLLAAIYPIGLSSVFSANEIFTLANLALLTYITIFLIRRLELAKDRVSGLITAPIAFALLWLGQFSFLIWDIDRSSVALDSSHVMRVIGLALFIRIYYLTGKGQPADDNEQAQ